MTGPAAAPPDATGPDRSRPHVLVVERHAHTGHGHFPIAFAHFAAALLAQGCTVTVLTSRGWARAGDPAFPPLEHRTYGPLARGLDALADRLLPTPFVTGARHLQTVVLVSAARVTARRAAADGVVVVTLAEPRSAAVVAGPGRWLTYATAPRRRTVGGPVRRRLGASGRALLRSVARRAEARRRRTGGRLRIATTSEPSRRAWADEAPWAEPVTLPMGVTGLVPAAATGPSPDLSVLPVLSDLPDLPAGVRRALCFGAPHRTKDPVTVWRAFRSLPEWRLIVAGEGAADAYRTWAAAEPPPPGAPDAVLVDGYVDEATKHALHRVADLAVLSFRAGWREDSGTLAEAVDHGLAVVCSDESAPAEVVAEAGLGAVFRAGDPDALAAAVRGLGAGPDPAGLARVRTRLDVGVVAQGWLAALGLAPPAGAGSRGPAAADR